MNEHIDWAIHILSQSAGELKQFASNPADLRKLVADKDKIRSTHEEMTRLMAMLEQPK